LKTLNPDEFNQALRPLTDKQPMKKLFLLIGFITLISCSHQSHPVMRHPSSEKDFTIMVDLGNKDLHVIEAGQTVGEFKIHMKDPAKNSQCKTSPNAGKFPVLKKELIYTSPNYGVIAHYAIGYKAGPGLIYLIKEDDGKKSVHGGHCGVMLSEGDGNKLFALLGDVEPKDITVEIFN
jgi:hypothetical protein